MNPIEAVAVAGADKLGAASSLNQAGAPKADAAGLGFGELFAQGMAGVEKKIETADNMVRAFALDDSIPVHQVTIALEEARLAVDLAMYVRTRLVEAYREIMNTQL